jgi:hypothetical protein
MLLKMIMTERSQSYKTKKPVSNRFFRFILLTLKITMLFPSPAHQYILHVFKSYWL